jgi:nitrate reductase gamma subunit
MDLLDLARGPALAASASVFVAGTLWRLLAIFRRPRQANSSPARPGAPSDAGAALGAVVRGLWPRRQFGQAAMVTTFNGYVFHVGLVLMALGYAPHIAFVERTIGLGWPALPDEVMYLASGATMLSLLFALWLRLNDPVRARISSADDYISWTLTFLPIATGMAVLGTPSQTILGPDHVVYRVPLAIHLLSLELLLIWFPFGKLMHAVLFAFSRSATGLRFARRGVQA